MEQDAGPHRRRIAAPRWALMARRFHEQALVDLESARENLRPRRYHNAVMFAEQAAEKALKAAFWHLRAEEPRHTHGMQAVAMGIGETVAGVPAEIVSALSELAAELERCRYPSDSLDEPIPADLVDEAAAVAAVAHAETVMTWTGSLLQLPTGRPRRRMSC